MGAPHAVGYVIARAYSVSPGLRGGGGGGGGGGELSNLKLFMPGHIRCYSTTILCWVNTVKHWKRDNIAVQV